jgi:glycosyltransferase involved in cell wall biosynthesis
VCSIPEVAGGAALLFDPRDAAQLAQHLAMVLSQAAEARRLRERGLARAADFTWHKTAQRILETYEVALQSTPSTPGEP